MAKASDSAQGRIGDHMPVVGSDGRHVGTVDAVEGELIRLTRSDPEAGGAHRWLPRSTVAGIEDGVVRLSMPAAQAGEAMETEESLARAAVLDPDAAAARRGRPVDDAPHGSRAHAHGGPKGQREHGQSGQASGPPGQTSFGVNRPVPGDPGPDPRRR
jgi:hypothetical protein